MERMTTTKLAALLVLTVFAVGCGASAEPASDEPEPVEPAAGVESEEPAPAPVVTTTVRSTSVTCPKADGASKDGA